MTSTDTSLEHESQRSVTWRPFWLRYASSLTTAFNMGVPSWWLTCKFIRRSCVSVGSGRVRGDPTPAPDLSGQRSALSDTQVRGRLPHPECAREEIEPTSRPKRPTLLSVSCPNVRRN